MTRFLPFFLVLLACSSRKKVPSANTVIQFSGNVTHTSSYCGGARPSEDILEEYNKPKPYRGKVLHVREGINNSAQGKVVLKLITNDSGYFSGTLPPGVYCIVQEEQLIPLDLGALSVKNKPIAVDTPCVEKWWKGALHELDLRNGSLLGIGINFHHPCFVSGDVPCRRYVGPMPP